MLKGFVLNVKKTLIVAGGGAAGFFCAVNAARLNPHLHVVIAEKTNKLLSKVKISGGGRCNLTHACYDINDMAAHYPRGKNFVKKSFHQFFTKDTIQWFEERGVAIKKEADGRMFPQSDSSQSVIECLLREANNYGVEILLNTEVAGIIKKENNFELRLKSGKMLQADYLCLATGGYPKAILFDWLKSTGHSIENPVPSLFTFNLLEHPIGSLMGISVPRVKVKIKGTKLEQEGALLITHWGLSGPAVLKLSAWGAKELAKMNYEFVVMVNWLPGFTEQSMKEKLQQLRATAASQKIISKNIFMLPSRLWEFLCLQIGIGIEMRWADLPTAILNKLVKQLCAMEMNVKGKTTFKEEFVTAGGICLQEVNPQTMQSKILPGLYFAGEILDVDGVTGGFNFQHAWTSGFIAAVNIASASGSAL